jgi:hypothetical protein
MRAECFSALNGPRYPPGHELTSLEIIGPTGAPPLMVVRSIVPHPEDGRWSRYLDGVQQLFERIDQDAEHAIHKRFDSSTSMPLESRRTTKASTDRDR